MEKKELHTSQVGPILLGLLPFWTPLIPPQGITSLKAYLSAKGYYATVFDGNIENEFKEIYDVYFNYLKKIVPEENWGNFYNIGHDVLRNHLMAYFNRTNKDKYNELVKQIIYYTYYTEISDNELVNLNQIISEYFNRLEHYIINIFEERNPKVFGLSCHLGNLASSLFACKLVKEKFPNVRTILGGTIFYWELPTVSLDFDNFVRNTPYVDNILIGQGEILFLKLLQNKISKMQKVITIDDIGQKTLEISSRPLPDMTDLVVDKYPYISAFGSVGCPFKCKFCNTESFFGQYKEKKIDQLVKEMKLLTTKYKNQLFFMNDALLNPIITDLSNALISEDFSVYMDGYMRISDEVTDTSNTILWRRGGLYRTRIGVESGSQRVLDLMDKKITINQIISSVVSLAHAGIKTTLYFVIGFPGETEEDFQQTLDLLTLLKNEIWQAECNPFYYYYHGQADSDKWANFRKSLYSKEFSEMLISPTWVLDCEPSREVRFNRLFRFCQHCKKLGIPNPYSNRELFEADMRWKSLHLNAVPSIVEFGRDVIINDKKNVDKFVNPKEMNFQDVNFNF